MLYTDTGFPCARDNRRGRICSVVLRSYAVERNFHFLNGQTVIFIVLALHSKPRGALCCLRPCAKAISCQGTTREGQPQAVAACRRSPQPTRCFPKAAPGNEPSKCSTMGKGDPFLPASREEGGVAPVWDGRLCRNAPNPVPDPLEPGKLL